MVHYILMLQILVKLLKLHTRVLTKPVFPYLVDCSIGHLSCVEVSGISCHPS